MSTKKPAADVHQIRAWRPLLAAGDPVREADEAPICGAVAETPGGYLPRAMSAAQVTCPGCHAVAGRTAEPTEEALEGAERAGVELRALVERLSAVLVPA